MRHFIKFVASDNYLLRKKWGKQSPIHFIAEKDEACATRTPKAI